MSKAATSMLVFGVYLLGLGAVLIAQPNVLLSAFGIPPAAEVWIRVVGMLVLFLGVYDVMAARGNWSGMIAASVPIRLSVIVFFAAFVVLLDAPPMLVFFGAVDAVFALWTWAALAADRRAARA